MEWGRGGGAGAEPCRFLGERGRGAEVLGALEDGGVGTAALAVAHFVGERGRGGPGVPPRWGRSAATVPMTALGLGQNCTKKPYPEHAWGYPGDPALPL